LKIWSTKNCLTEGITEHGVGTPKDGNDMIVLPKTESKQAVYLFKEGNDWHRTREEAVERALLLRKRAIEALRRKITRYEALYFS